MALAGRPSRRGGGLRWVVIGLLITAVVLLIDVSIKSRSPTPGRQLAAQAWVDRALSLVEASNTEGLQLAAFRTGSASSASPAQVQAELTTMANGTEKTYQELKALPVPTQLQTSAGLLTTCLQVRAEATASLVHAVERVLRAAGTPAPATTSVTTAPTSVPASSTSVPTGATTASTVATTSSLPVATTVPPVTTTTVPPVSPALAASATRAITAAVQRLEVADEVYKLFASGLPRSLGVQAPKSVWVNDAGLYSQLGVEVFLDQLRSRVSLAPDYEVDIVTVSTQPSPIRTRKGVRFLAPSPTLGVTIVVADVGNQNDTDLAVTASVAPAVGRASAGADVNLVPGQAETVNLGPLAPPLGTRFDLTVTVDPPVGSLVPVKTRVLTLEMPSPTSSSPSASTSTVPPAATTTTSVPATT